MADKQIIIDGVNVVECPHRKKEVTFMNVIKCYNYGACEGVNCLYKQLKRKEQECEELKKDIKDIANLLDLDTGEEYNFSNIEMETKELKAENEELKKQLTILDDEDVVVEITVKQFEEYKKLKQTLAEIKEIAEDFYLDGEHVKNKYLAQEILQKISECEVENDR